MSGMKSDFTTKYSPPISLDDSKQYEGSFTEYRFFQLNTQHYKFESRLEIFER